MTSLDSAPGPAAAGSRVARRPGPVARWLAAGLVALPEVWTLSAVVIGSFGLAAWGYAEVLVVLAVAVFVGLGRRWAYGAVIVLGAGAMIVANADPGMLSGAFWLVGALYVAMGLVLLIASRRRRAQS